MFIRPGSDTLSTAERSISASDTMRASGRQSNGSSSPTPASSDAMTLRTVWPHAERVDRPYSSIWSSSAGT